MCGRRIIKAALRGAVHTDLPPGYDMEAFPMHCIHGHDRRRTTYQELDVCTEQGHGRVHYVQQYNDKNRLCDDESCAPAGVLPMWSRPSWMRLTPRSGED